MQTTIVITHKTKNGSKERERRVGTERERKQLPDRYIPGMHGAKPQIRAEKRRGKNHRGSYFQPGRGREERHLALKRLVSRRRQHFRTIQMTEEKDLELEEIDTWYSVLIRLMVSISFGTMFQC